jgi:hypothetical protein
MIGAKGPLTCDVISMLFCYPIYSRFRDRLRTHFRLNCQTAPLSLSPTSTKGVW